MKEIIRAGLFYQRIGEREISVVPPSASTPSLIKSIQAHRGQAYGDVPAVVNGLNVHLSDEKSFHVVAIDSSGIIASARYLRDEVVELGGFVIKEECRGGRLAMLAIGKIQQLAMLMGDLRFRADASVELGCSSILKKLGGKVVDEYFSSDYRRHVELIEFNL